jgi:hypothetical protein
MVSDTKRRDSEAKRKEVEVIENDFKEHQNEVVTENKVNEVALKTGSNKEKPSIVV